MNLIGTESTVDEVDGHLVGLQKPGSVEARCAEIRNGKKPQEQCLWNDQNNSTREELEADLSARTTMKPIHTERSKWEPPPDGIWKLNSNVAFLTNTGDTVAGTIVRTHQGVVALACGQRLHACKYPE